MEVKTFNANPTFNGWYCAQCECGVAPSEVTFQETHTVCGRYIREDEPPAKKSEIEMVREALDKHDESTSVTFHHTGGWTIAGLSGRVEEGVGGESLLTWAKQTIGESPAPEGE